MQRRTGGKQLLMCGLALVLTLPAGCLSCCNPLHPPPKAEVLPLNDVAQCQRNKVYVFFVHGLDPLDASNYSGLHDWVQSLGYIKTYYGWTYHSFHFEKEIRRIHHEQPDARFVLVGFSYGAGMVRDLACSLRSAGVTIDLLVYIDGVEIDSRPLHRPANVQQVVNILSFNRSDRRIVPEGENHRYSDVWHFATVTHPKTLLLLAQELGNVARRVPIVYRMPPEPVPAPEGVPAPAPHPGTLPPPHPAPEQLPPPHEQGKATMVSRPRPAPAPAAEAPRRDRGEWDFLQPDPLSQGAPGSKPWSEAWATPPGPTREQ